MAEKVLLLENINPIAGKIFYENGFKVESLPGSLHQNDLHKKVKDISILGIRSKTYISKEVLNYADSLKVLGAYCIGTDQINIPECSAKGVAIFNAPYSNTRSVAELVMGDITMLLRGIFDKSRDMHNGIWNKSSENSSEVRGKTLGIVGYGHIGSQAADLAERKGMNVVYFDLVPQQSRGNVKKCNSLEELLKISDVVTLHVDGRERNRGFFGKKEFEAMKDKSYFLNLSRGFVLDEYALAEYIDNGKIIGAAIDVFQKEPLNNNEEFKSPLQNKKNVILTPHIGGNTREAQEDIASFVSNKLISFYLNGDTSLSVNLPPTILEPEDHKTRFSHLHKNVPGVMAGLSDIFANHKINISSQSLKTKDNLGYLIATIDSPLYDGLADELKKVDGTIRLRIM
jgi:D-3-phosphoglycerate dehydrogenase